MGTRCHDRKGPWSERDFTNPSEVCRILQLGRGTFEAEGVTLDLLLFARILQQWHRGVSLLRARLASIEQTFAGDATTRPQDVPKAMVRALADELTRTAPEIARVAGRLETEAARGEMAAFSVGLTEQIDAWRQAGAH